MSEKRTSLRTGENLQTQRIDPLVRYPYARARKALLICGILSSLLYVGTDRLAAALWTGYSSTSQTVSELIAIDSPARPLVVPLFFVYSLLIFAFGCGVFMSATDRHPLHLRLYALDRNIHHCPVAEGRKQGKFEMNLKVLIGSGDKIWRLTAPCC